jgi:hypothetical protein
MGRPMSYSCLSRPDLEHVAPRFETPAPDMTKVRNVSTTGTHWASKPGSLTLCFMYSCYLHGQGFIAAMSMKLAGTPVDFTLFSS